MRIALLLAGIAFAASAAAAPPPDEATLTTAKAHFELGRAFYRQERWADSLREFEAGYALVPKPQFLLNMAQAHRHLSQLDRAAALYEKFLAEAPADDPAREQAERLLAAVRKDAAPAPPPAPVEPPPEPKTPPPSAAPPSAASPQPVGVLIAPAAPSSAPPHRKSFVRRHWWIFPVAAVVVAGVAVGLALGLQPAGGCSHSSTPCLDWGAR